MILITRQEGRFSLFWKHTTLDRKNV